MPYEVGFTTVAEFYYEIVGEAQNTYLGNPKRSCDFQKIGAYSLKLFCTGGFSEIKFFRWCD